jgi:hypothetical protein
MLEQYILITKNLLILNHHIPSIPSPIAILWQKTLMLLEVCARNELYKKHWSTSEIVNEVEQKFYHNDSNK